MTQKPPEKLPQFDVSFVFCVRAERVETQECGLAFRGLLIVETNFQEAKEFLLFSLLLLLQLSRYCVLCVAEAEYKKKKKYVAKRSAAVKCLGLCCCTLGSASLAPRSAIVSFRSFPRPQLAFYELIRWPLLLLHPFGRPASAGVCLNLLPVAICTYICTYMAYIASTLTTHKLVEYVAYVA